MTNDGSKMTSKSPEIQRRQKSLKVKIFDWKKKGYNVSRFTKLIDHDISVAEEEFKEFLKTVKQMERMEERLFTLDTTGYEEQVNSIEDMLKNPDMIDKLEKEIILLEESILKKKLEAEAKAEGENEKPEFNFDKELEKIRSEELERIRNEEGDRLKEQERRKILSEELGRIRMEEREKLRKSEVKRIRREEKERMVWEDRVLRQLRQTKEREVEKAGQKKMKCPSCKGIIAVTSSKRPLKVRCPKCGKDYTLKAKGNASESKIADSKKIQYKKCPKCSSPIPVISDKRPLKIICQMCDSEYLLKEKRLGDVGEGIPTAPGSLANRSIPLRGSRTGTLKTRDYGSQDIKQGGRSIVCPTCGKDIPEEVKICGYCGSPIDRAEVQQKKGVPCTKCGKEIPGDARICGYCGTPVTAGAPQSPRDELELPLTPNEMMIDVPVDRTAFKPLNEYNLPPGPGPAPPDAMMRIAGPTEGITCSKCGNSVPRGAKFCGVCGNTM